MNNDIKFLEIECAPYPLTNFEDRFGLHASFIFLDYFFYVWFPVHLDTS